MAVAARARPSLLPVLGPSAQTVPKSLPEPVPLGQGRNARGLSPPEHPSTRDRWEVVGKHPASLPFRGTHLVYSLCPSTPSVPGLELPPWPGCPPPMSLLLLQPPHPPTRLLESPPHKLPHSHPGSGLLWEDPDVDTGSPCSCGFPSETGPP